MPHDDTATRIRDQVVLVLRNHVRFVELADVVPLDVDLRELGLDSLAAIDFLLALEQSFGIVFPDELLTEETFRNAQSVTNALMTLLQRSDRA